jgi:NADH-quinone oxidoreductase subunit N
MENIMYSVVSLQSFTVFAEYFIALSIIYILIVVTLIMYNSDGLMLQKALSECSALILFLACYLLLNDDLITGNFTSFNGSIINDELALVTKFVVCFSAALYFLFTADSLKEQKLTSFEYLVIVLFATLGLILMCSSNDLLITYLAIELSTLSFYVLASYKKTSTYSVESGIKYFITGAISSAFFLLGSSFIYGLTGSINFHDFFHLFTDPQSRVIFPISLPESNWTDEQLITFSEFFYRQYLMELNYDNPMSIYYQTTPQIMGLGFIFILFSLLIKLGLAPFHLWSLDVYEGSPTSTTIFFAVVAKLSTFVVLIRLCYLSLHYQSNDWTFYFLWIGLLSVFVGSFGGLKQRKVKTLMAYSSISHMGYAILALSAAQAPSKFAIVSVLFYIILYMISGLCIWSIVLFLRLRRKTDFVKYNKELGDFALLNKANRPISFAFALSMFSLAGIPPLAGFLAKAGIFFQLISKGNFLISLFAVLCSVISTFYYIRIIKILYFEKVLVGKLYHPISSEKTIVFSLLVFSLIFLFVNPTLLYLICFKASVGVTHIGVSGV